jgi:hypothetical protein
MSSKFNIIQNIYELIFLAQLKKDYYKRIDDVKSRKRLNAVIIAKIEIETKTTINKIVNIITISISINEKAKQISIKTTIWNFNQFRTSTSRIIKTFNFDSIKEEFMKAKKCCNCNEFDHLNRNCSKSRKFKIIEMNVRELENIKNSRKE